MEEVFFSWVFVPIGYMEKHLSILWVLSVLKGAIKVACFFPLKFWAVVGWFCSFFILFVRTKGMVTLIHCFENPNLHICFKLPPNFNYKSVSFRFLFFNWCFEIFHLRRVMQSQTFPVLKKIKQHRLYMPIILLLFQIIHHQMKQYFFLESCCKTRSMCMCEMLTRNAPGRC